MLEIAENELSYYQTYLMNVLMNGTVEEIDYNIIPKQVLPGVIKSLVYEKHELIASFPSLKRSLLILLEENILQPSFSFEERYEYVELLKEIRHLNIDLKALYHFYANETLKRGIAVKSFKVMRICAKYDFLVSEIIRTGEIPLDLNPTYIRQSINYFKANYICLRNDENYQLIKTKIDDEKEE